jgi:hypothetical protein
LLSSDAIQAGYSVALGKEHGFAGQDAAILFLTSQHFNLIQIELDCEGTLPTGD